jgi:DhnA family fructose-bisphosphate aldolase class Ia
MDTIKDLLQLVSDSIKAGGSGVAFGRNIFQYKDPQKLVSAISSIVHQNYSVRDAIKNFDLD